MCFACFGRFLPQRRPHHLRLRVSVTIGIIARKKSAGFNVLLVHLFANKSFILQETHKLQFQEELVFRYRK